MIIFFSQSIRKHDVNVITNGCGIKAEFPFKIFLVEKRGFISARPHIIQLTFIYRVLEYTSGINKNSINWSKISVSCERESEFM